MKLSFFQKLMLLLNVVTALCLFGAYQAPYANPSGATWVPLLGLSYPYILAVNLLFIVYWFLFKRLFMLVSLVFIFLGWSHLQTVFALNIKPKPNEESKVFFKVMSYNVQNFDLYNWTANEESRDNMMRLIKKENPDIVTFQEFYTQETGDFHNIQQLVNQLDFKHFHFEKTLTLDGNRHWGLATFSKFPLSNKQSITVEGTKKGNLITYCDVEMPDTRLIRIFNVHLQSIGFGKKDYKFFKEITQTQKTPDLTASKSIVKKLNDAYAKRSKQAEILQQAISDCKRPVVVCGDFNDTPLSYTYHTISKDLKDTFLERGFGGGGTYAGPLPSFRIDYIFVDSLFHVHDFDVIQQKYSDHYPITTMVGY